MKADKTKKQKYHKTYVLLGVQQNLSFQNQPQDYITLDR